MREAIIKILKEHNIENVHGIAEEINLAIFDNFIPMLDMMEVRLREGCKIAVNDNKTLTLVEPVKGEIIATGGTLRALFLDFFWLETSDGNDG